MNHESNYWRCVVLGLCSAGRWRGAGDLKRWNTVGLTTDAFACGLGFALTSVRQPLINVVKLLRVHGGCLGVERR